MNGVWENLCLQFGHNFCGFEKVGEEAREVLSNSRSLSKKLKPELQEEDFLDLLAVHTRSLLMKTWWNWRPREKMKRDNRKKKWLKNWRDSGCRKWRGVFFTWGGAVSFWGTGPELRTVHEGCNSHSECKPVLPCRLWQGQKEPATQVSLNHFCQRLDRIESSEEPELELSMSGLNWIAAYNCSWQSFSSTISHFLSLLQSVSLLACSLDTSPCMPAVVLYYCTFQALYCKIENIFLIFCFFNVLFVWKVLQTYCSTVLFSWLC